MSKNPTNTTKIQLATETHNAIQEAQNLVASARVELEEAKATAEQARTDAIDGGGKLSAVTNALTGVDIAQARFDRAENRLKEALDQSREGFGAAGGVLAELGIQMADTLHATIKKFLIKPGNESAFFVDIIVGEAVNCSVATSALAMQARAISFGGHPGHLSPAQAADYLRNAIRQIETSEQIIDILRNAKVIEAFHQAAVLSEFLGEARMQFSQRGLIPDPNGTVPDSDPEDPGDTPAEPTGEPVQGEEKLSRFVG